MSKYQKMHKVTLQSLRPLQKWHRFLLPETDASYILSLYKKEELSPKCYMDLLIIISDAIDYLKDPVWEEVGYSICKKI